MDHTEDNGSYQTVFTTRWLCKTTDKSIVHRRRKQCREPRARLIVTLLVTCCHFSSTKYSSDVGGMTSVMFDLRTRFTQSPAPFSDQPLLSLRQNIVASKIIFCQYQDKTRQKETRRRDVGVLLLCMMLPAFILLLRLPVARLLTWQ